MEMSKKLLLTAILLGSSVAPARSADLSEFGQAIKKCAQIRDAKNYDNDMVDPKTLPAHAEFSFAMDEVQMESILKKVKDHSAVCFALGADYAQGIKYIDNKVSNCDLFVLKDKSPALKQVRIQLSVLKDQLGGYCGLYVEHEVRHPSEDTPEDIKADIEQENQEIAHYDSTVKKGLVARGDIVGLKAKMKEISDYLGELASAVRDAQK